MVPAGAAAPGPELVEAASDQVTPAGSPVAVNCKDWLTAMADWGGVRVMAMALAVPDTLMTWGESAALSVRVMVSERGPAAVGVKVMEMVQAAWEGTSPLQVFELMKSPGLLPAMATEEMCRAPAAESVTVTTMGELEAPRAVSGKATGLGEMAAAGLPGAGVFCTRPQPAAKRRSEKMEKERKRFPNNRLLDNGVVPPRVSLESL